VMTDQPSVFHLLRFSLWTVLFWQGQSQRAKPASLPTYVTASSPQPLLEKSKPVP
jgi:hypothetical protein